MTPMYADGPCAGWRCRSSAKHGVERRPQAGQETESTSLRSPHIGVHRRPSAENFLRRSPTQCYALRRALAASSHGKEGDCAARGFFKRIRRWPPMYADGWCAGWRCGSSAKFATECRPQAGHRTLGPQALDHHSSAYIGVHRRKKPSGAVRPHPPTAALRAPAGPSLSPRERCLGADRGLKCRP